jgi:hypothetical protein
MKVVFINPEFNDAQPSLVYHGKISDIFWRE